MSVFCLVPRTVERSLCFLFPLAHFVTSGLAQNFTALHEPCRFGFAISNPPKLMPGVKPGISFGAPGRSRTCNLILRTDLLYPVELPRHDD